MFAAITAARQGARVLLLEKNDRLGKKLLITGKGRCNVTNDCSAQEVLQNIPRNGRFLYSAMAAFPPEKTMEFFRELEVLTPRWRALLDTAEERELPRRVIPMARYLVNRYWLQAVSDLDLYGRVKFMVLSALLVGSLAGDFVSNAQLWSKEIENDPENLDAILDGAYYSGALTDSKLLGLLLGKQVR